MTTKVTRRSSPRCAHVLTVLGMCLLLLSPEAESCTPGRGLTRRRRPRKLTPLVFKQHVPNVSEDTLGASGIAEGPIKRSDAKFKDLVLNNNRYIKFKDEERTGADRIMTKRCEDKLNELAVSVMNMWPGVQLRVTEAWDEDDMHAEDSLHYEGRAVDITTSDRDKAKYGMLARLAVEAGFDWVYYESRGHIHCSVKSDSSVAIKIGGCFPGSSDVISSGGVTKSMRDVRLGDQVLSVDGDGRLTYSQVIAFLDRDPDQHGLFYTLTTDRGRSVTLTAKHLIYVARSNVTTAGGYGDVPGDGDGDVILGGEDTSRLKTLFAEDVRVGDVIMVVEDDNGYNNDGGGRGGGGGDGSCEAVGQSRRDCHPHAQPPAAGGVLPATRMSPARVTRVEAAVQAGVFAPLTTTGTIVVDGTVTSCYAVINNPALAHAVFAPMRGWHELSSRLSWLSSLFPSSSSSSSSSAAEAHHDVVALSAPPQKGMHFYAKLLYKLGSVLLSPSVLYVP